MPLKAQEIAASTMIPLSYLSKVLAALARAELVQARRGRLGGFKLSRPVDQISAFDVITAVESWKALDHCPIGRPDHAHRLCPLHQKIARIQADVEQAFRQSTLRDLLETPPHSGFAVFGKPQP